MDSLTQAVLGAVVGEVILSKKIGWRGAVLGAVIATIPDLDVVALPFLDAAEGIRWHRGLSHSILIMVLASLILAKPISILHRKRGVTVWDAGLLVFWAWSTHVLIDCFTTYGTQIYEPFSSERVSLDIFYIVDPLFTLPLLVGLWVALTRTENSKSRKLAIYSGITAASLYVAFGFFMQTWARKEISENMNLSIEGGELVGVAPSSFNTILWRGLIETEEGYFLSYWSPFDKELPKCEFIEKRRNLMSAYEGEEELAALKWFSQGHWVARNGEDGKVILIDMRFAEIRDPKSGSLQPIFQWHLERDGLGLIHAPMLRPKGLDYGGATMLLWHRVFGDQKGWRAMKEF